MAINRDLRQLISILIDEGFGAVAGEILAEVEAGRAVEREVTRDGDGDDPTDTIVALEPIREEDQFGLAIALLRERLVEPARAFARAERMASELVAEQAEVRIRFVTPDEYAEDAPLATGAIGSESAASKLDAVLLELPNGLEPERGTET